MIQSIFLFLRRGLQIRRNFSTTCTTLGTRGEKLQADAALCTRIAENGADKVLSSEEENPSVHKTYVNFPTSRKSALDVPLYAISSGRSMVEMLGVLTIIGVLSVGAIAGYSKAMFKYKLNKQEEQISTILYNSLTSAEQFSPPPPNPGTSSVEDMIPIYIKLGYIPVEMIKPRLTDNVFDAFNNNIYVKYINWDTSPSQKYLQLTVWFSTPDVAQCMNILTLFKAMRENLYSAFIYRSYENSDNNSFISRMAGNILCANKYNTYPCLKNITISEMQHLCDVCAETQSCRLSVQYNHTN